MNDPLAMFDVVDLLDVRRTAGVSLGGAFAGLALAVLELVAGRRRHADRRDDGLGAGRPSGISSRSTASPGRVPGRDVDERAAALAADGR